MHERTQTGNSRHLALAAFGIGAIAGLRSMAAPAIVSWGANRNWIHSSTRRTAFLSNKAAAYILTALAIGELVVDKLPQTPSRTQPVALGVRALTGGFCGATLWASKERSFVNGAALGAVGAIAGAFAGYQLRRRLRTKLQVKDPAIAVLEDAVTVGGGLLLMRSA